MWSALVLLSLIGCALAGPPVSRSRSDIESFKEFLEKSRQDDGIRLESRMLMNPKASVWENSGKLQGDILLNDEQAELLVKQYAEGRNAYIWPNTKWPHNTIVYEFNNEFTQAQINAIYNGMREIEARTCIRFRRRAANEFNYVRITINAIYNGMREIEARTCIRFRRRAANEFNYVRITGHNNGCYANVGFWHTWGVHTLNLARDNPGHGCFHHTVIIHEWLHVVGFFHMQSTYNRDHYVQILWHNIWPGMEHNFDRYGTDIVHNMGLPYEYASTMHYGRYGFSTNGQPTMLPIHNDHGLMGQTQFISGWDWLRASRHYNCPGAWSAEINEEELSKPVPFEYENFHEENEEIREFEDAPFEEAVVEDVPQEDNAADTVNFVEDVQ
ncbi:hypothetical protein PYW08_013811 [Mythimna loreyi]|uniref:Uncharacterized protein n=1 Tax=Mythimna loreyi TaxID=667449 RepID=A0ACC2R614_9NEOP|nr:hypothetical protein PYW08_013811 [Mythimna loreyi]